MVNHHHLDSLNLHLTLSIHPLNLRNDQCLPHSADPFLFQDLNQFLVNSSNLSSRVSPMF